MANSRRILVVDDNQTIINLLRGILTHSGYTVLSATNGVDGLAIARREIPDLIILDIIMPKMDGYQVCWNLQQDPSTARIPVLILTVKGNTEQKLSSARERWDHPRKTKERLQGYDVGAVEFISKPIPAGELLKRVKALLWITSTES